MSGRSARNYWTDADLTKDAAFWRRREEELRRRALTEIDPHWTLVSANSAKMRAEASEAVLAKRKAGSA